MSRWAVTFPAFHPLKENSAWEIGVSPRKLDAIKKAGHHDKLARLLLVNEVASDPQCIVEGWTRVDREECLVYVGHPNRDFVKRGIEVPAPKNMLYLVFVLPDGTIDDWGWRPIEPESDLPSGIEGKILWPLNP